MSPSRLPVGGRALGHAAIHRLDSDARGFFAHGIIHVRGQEDLRWPSSMFDVFENPRRSGAGKEAVAVSKMGEAARVCTTDASPDCSHAANHGAVGGSFRSNASR